MEEKIKDEGKDKKKQKFHKERFEKIPEERRKKIMDAALSEFATNGFRGTNINKVAEKAGISIGSMYSYFESKDDLFLTVVEQLLSVLEDALREIDVVKGDIRTIVEQLFIRAHDYAVTYPEMNQIYLDVTTQSLSNLSSRVSGKLESVTVNLYREVIERAKAQGTVGDRIDEGIMAFCLDNLIMMFQFSFTSDYYRERMQIFLGEEIMADEEKMIKGMTDFVIGAVSPK